jgi:hypothetical protein
MAAPLSFSQIYFHPSAIFPSSSVSFCMTLRQVNLLPNPAQFLIPDTAFPALRHLELNRLGAHTIVHLCALAPLVS